MPVSSLGVNCFIVLQKYNDVGFENLYQIVYNHHTVLVHRLSKKCFGEFGVCCTKFGNFIPFGEVCERVLHDGSRLLYGQPNL